MAAPELITLVASPIVNLVIEKLTSRAWKELKSMWSLDTSRLETRLSTIMDVLEEAERSPVAADSTDAVYKWLNKLKDAAYDADDVVYECHAEVLRQKTKTKNTFAFRHRMNKKLKDVMKTLDEIVEDRQWLRLSDRRTASFQTLDQGRETSSVLIVSKIYGRRDDQEKVKNYLINEGNENEVTAVAIVGLGGIGKTTLAQSIYNDEKISREFDRQLWVWVSKDFRVDTILRKMIERITIKECNLTQIDSMHQRLKGLLSGRRFLLVLDDVWTEDEMQWSCLQSHLRVLGKKGSKILVTARCLQVARIMRSNSTHQLEALSNEDCWEIFKDRAFGPDRVEKTPRLEEIGMEIARKCGGLPLAAEAMGSLMGTRSGEQEWLDVQDAEMWRLPEDSTKILSALKLSYHHMPSHLKQCFVYCSLFPKKYRFGKEKITCLWIAEGFIPTSIEGLPDVCSADSSYFDSLLEIYFFQDAERHYNSPVVACQMHDVVHDLAWSVAGDEFLFASENKLTYKKTWEKRSCRYLSIICDSSSLDSLNNNSSCKIDKVRSLILLPQERNPRCNLREDNWEMLLKLSLLRVLDLSSTNISELPHTISHLQRLRHLNLSNTDIRTLPDTITSLYYLLTLNLAYCRQLEELPKGVNTMSNLRNLDVYGCDSLTCLPARIGRLSELRVLTMFIVGTKEGHTIKELRHMKIMGRLQIKNLHNVKDQEGAEIVNLPGKKDLRQLELYWNGNCDNARDVFEGLQPCQDLKKLKISGYEGIQFPSWMSAGLRGVRELSIVNCQVSALSSWSNGLQSFISLEKLKISSCKDLSCLPDNIIQLHIFSLRTLDISDNENLISLVEKEGQEAPILFTSLHSLMLGKCKSLVELPKWLDRLTSLKSLDLSACCKLGRLHQLKTLVDRISITLCQDLARRYKEETGDDWNMPIISIAEETQLEGEQETQSSRQQSGSASKFFRRLGQRIFVKAE